MTKQYPIPDDACEFKFVHASGPGGQHVNKTSSAVELRVTLERLHLPLGTLHRLRTQQRNRVNNRGELLIQAEQYRSQHKNKDDALKRLAQMIELAAQVPKKRVPTRPSASARRRRIDNKKKRGATKASRGKPKLD